MNSWWNTPLYSQFLENVMRNISSGKIVIVFLPKHTPNEFLSQLRETFETKNMIHYERITFENCNGKENRPIESLVYTQLGLNEVTDQFISKSASSIFDYEKCDPSRVFVFENPPRSFKAQFRDFLIDLGHYSNSKQVYERHKVIVPLNPEYFASTDFLSESGIQSVLFQGVFDKLDLNVGIRYFQNYENDVFTSYCEKIIVSLALFDFRLAERLIECDDIIENWPLCLETYAKDNGWEKINYKIIDRLKEEEIWGLWSKGILDKSNNKYIYNSAFLKIHDKDEDVNRRVWQSGIEILIPLIEEIRVKILNSDKVDFNGVSVFENKKTGEKIGNKMDLEIGEIWYYLNKHTIRIRWLSPPERRLIIDYINLSKTIRNDLSHLRIPASENIKKFFRDHNRVKKLLKSNN